ncbi:MAG TPA: hypothetical protein EYN79_03800, partial [Planctomycetes bacterium]|nr:hypothetical protein [Planctomycetota bacterium]
MRFAPVEELVREIANGNVVILVDDAERENEGDFVAAAQKVSPETIRFMATGALRKPPSVPTSCISWPSSS